MIRFQRTVRLKVGLGVDTLKEIAEYANTNFDIDMKIWGEIGRDFHRFHITADFEDMEAYGIFQIKMNTDQKYLELHAPILEHLIEGSVEDFLLRER